MLRIGELITGYRDTAKKNAEERKEKNKQKYEIINNKNWRS